MKIIFVLILSFCQINCLAQKERFRVVDSPITNRYKNAVSKGFYSMLNTFSGLQKGYQGSVVTGYTIGIGHHDIDCIELSTTHGYRLNPYFFIGGGAGCSFYKKYSTADTYTPLDVRKNQVDVPLYAAIRYVVLNSSVTPFLDTRVGHFITHNGGVYLHFSLGCRVSTYGQQALNFLIGYSYENLEYHSIGLDYSHKYRNLGTEGIFFKLEYEF